MLTLAISSATHHKTLIFKVVTGTWLVDGNPQIILFDIGSAAWKLDEYKQELWDSCHFGIPHLDIEANDAVIFGYLVCQFISEFRYKKSRCACHRVYTCMCIYVHMYVCS